MLRVLGNQIQLVDAACVKSLSAWLTSKQCRLNGLLLGSNQLRDDGALILAEIIQANTSLLKLDLRSNSITSRGLCALGPVASSHCALQVYCHQTNAQRCAAIHWPRADLLRDTG